jgi:hypothetical protein
VDIVTIWLFSTLTARNGALLGRLGRHRAEPDKTILGAARMKKLSFVLVAAGLMSLAACSKPASEDNAASAMDNAAAAMDNAASSMESATDNMTSAADNAAAAANSAAAAASNASNAM